jgi:hypothetical protein
VELIVTEYLAQRARGADACSVPSVGTPVSDLDQSQLIWSEDSGILSRDELSTLTLPLWAMATSGYGYGSGYGDGYGDGRAA